MNLVKLIKFGSREKTTTPQTERLCAFHVFISSLMLSRFKKHLHASEKKSTHRSKQYYTQEARARKK